MKNLKKQTPPPDPWVVRLQQLCIGLSILLTCVILPLYALKVMNKTDYTDFSVYYRAALRMKQGHWTQIYSLQDGASPFRYSPIFLPFFRPFAELSLQTALWIWYFLQAGCFFAGFYLIYLTLGAFRSAQRGRLWITCFSYLFILRFCLDTFTIGQVSSLMFLGFALGLYSWVVRRPVLFSIGVLIPTLFKIGPGFLFGVFASARMKEKQKGIFTTLAVITVTGISSALTLGSWEHVQMLWREWTQIVLKDSQYYDASHYGSQSLNSFLLRSAHAGWISSSMAGTIHLLSVLVVCGGIGWFWLSRRPRSYYGRGLFYSLGIFAYLWLMPETFKYSLTPLAVPVALILASPRRLNWSSRFALGFGVATLSLAGKDLIGDPLFFGFQNYSLPFFATLLLAWTNFRLAYLESVPAQGLAAFLRSAGDAIRPSRNQLGPWKSTPRTWNQRPLKASLLIPVPLNGTMGLNPELSQKLILEAAQVLQDHHSSSLTDPPFEILLIVYGDRISAFHPLYSALLELTRVRKEIRILHHEENNGRASALRTGFLASSGKTILIAQIEQPSSPQFFTDALRCIDSGVDLVRANRRLSETRFRIPVELLPIVYRRHRLGLLFNRLVRSILPIQSTDTHSGTLGMSWRLALNAFALQSSPDFLFDLEIGLTSVGHGFSEKDLPVSLDLATEKSFRRILLETLNILQGLPSLAWRYSKGYYRPLPSATGITADDWGLSPAINRGILHLARSGVIRRISLMANTAYLTEGLEELKKLPVELGLHFNLTYGRPLQADTLLAQSPGELLGVWLSPRRNRKELHARVREELTLQIEKLESVGVQVAYLDGHHHIQLIPGLIEVLAEIIQKKGIHIIRLPYDKALLKSLKAPLVLFSMMNFRIFKKQGFQTMDCFYPQNIHFRDHGLFRARLAQNPAAEVIVHPAESNDLMNLEFPDTYTEGRVLEYRALKMLALPEEVVS